MKKPLPVCAVMFVAVASGCRSADSEYAGVAKDANAALEKLREPAAIILADDAPAERVRMACTAAERDLLALRNVDFHDRKIARKAGKMEVSAIVATMLEQRPAMCLPDSGDGSRDAICQRWCIERWRAFADSLERVRLDARQAGVEIVSISAAK